MCGSVIVSGRPARDLLDEERDHRSTRRHDVAVAGHAHHRLRRRVVAGEGLGNLLHHRLRHAHGVDRVHRLVGAEAHDRAHAVAVRRLDDVVGCRARWSARPASGRTRMTAPA